MKARSPLITLFFIAAVGLILLAVNLSKSPTDQTAAQIAPSTTAEAAPAPPPAPAETAPAPQPAAQPEPFPAEAKYLGHTDGNGAAIAITVRNGQVAAYLCDGKSVEGWYQGSAADGTIDAKGRGSNALTGSLSGSKLSGTVSAGGKSWTYSAEPTAAPAGLYRAKSGVRTTGWIKDSNGQVTGLSNENGVVGPAAPLNPAGAQFVQGDNKVVGQ
jgi:hypothetical protein